MCVWRSTVCKMPEEKKKKKRKTMTEMNVQWNVRFRLERNSESTECVKDLYRAYSCYSFSFFATLSLCLSFSPAPPFSELRVRDTRNCVQYRDRCTRVTSMHHASKNRRHSTKLKFSFFILCRSFTSPVVTATAVARQHQQLGAKQRHRRTNERRQI